MLKQIGKRVCVETAICDKRQPHQGSARGDDPHAPEQQRKCISIQNRFEQKWLNSNQRQSQKQFHLAFAGENLPVQLSNRL